MWYTNTQMELDTSLQQRVTFTVCVPLDSEGDIYKKERERRGFERLACNTWGEKSVAYFNALFQHCQRISVWLSWKLKPQFVHIQETVFFMAAEVDKWARFVWSVALQQEQTLCTEGWGVEGSVNSLPQVMSFDDVSWGTRLHQPYLAQQTQIYDQTVGNPVVLWVRKKKHGNKKRLYL